jgi:pyruvate dehydrogenase E2 component (dihydrolipoamide acetyltransferase)
MLNKSTLAFWKKEEGDYVEKGEPIFDIETEKATITARSPYKGILKKILVQTEVQLR